MDKYIIDDLVFYVEENEHSDFIKIMKELKEKLNNLDLLPDKFELFKDIDNDKNTFKLYLGFKSDSDYDKWEEKANKLVTKEDKSKFGKYVKKYNYLEKINLD